MIISVLVFISILGETLFHGMKKPNSVIKASFHYRYEVVRDNWYNLLDPEIAEDLRSRRTYNERSVSGLLRALRNKKHHYQVILTTKQNANDFSPNYYGIL